MYDQYGFYSDNGSRRAAPGGGGRSARARTWVSAASIFRNSSISSAGSRRGPAARRMAGAAAANFQDIFSQLFGASEQRAAADGPEKGTDLEYGLNIDFWQAIRGTQVQLNIKRQEVCDDLQRHGARPGGNARSARNATAAAT